MNSETIDNDTMDNGLTSDKEQKEQKDKKEVKEQTDKKEVKEQTEVKEQKKKKHNRCDYCNVKLGLIFFTCKCEKNYCHKHLNPHSHGCLFDNRQACRNAIKENNPQMKTNTLIKV